jgi:hypothetical protein
MLLVVCATTFQNLKTTAGFFLIARDKPGEDSNSLFRKAADLGAGR